jgi:hypothetical protein
MNTAVKQFTNNASAKRYFSNFNLDVKYNKTCGEIARCATITLIDNIIEAKSNYFTEYTLEKMLNSKGKEY